MTKATNKKESLEILLSTMGRTSLSFLEHIFPEDSYLNYNILIINQTHHDKILESDHNNIRVINTFEKGLTKSRNLAIENAIGSICLIADDDVRYVKDLKKIILSGFEKHKEADIITFQMVDHKGILFRSYKDCIQHDKKSISTANSVVIAFKKDKIVDNDVRFDPNFGLGSTFETANEYVFLRNALKSNLKLYFESQVILSHEAFSSGQDAGSDKLVFARSALFYKYSGVFAYLRLCKHLYGLKALKKIEGNEVWHKFKVGIKGIKEYKKLQSQASEID
jgi:glycosyltransferase involved in cell wall biosynthesis